MPRLHDCLGGVFEAFGRILDHQRRRVEIVQQLPDGIKPIRVAELLGVISLAPLRPDRLAASAPLDLNAADAGDRVAVAGLRIGRLQTADVETNLEMADALAHIVLFRTVYGSDDLAGLLPRIGELLPVNGGKDNVEGLTKPAEHFVLALDCQRCRAEGQYAFDGFAELAFFDAQASHN
jgi:hypothetical protein